MSQAGGANGGGGAAAGPPAAAPAAAAAAGQVAAPVTPVNARALWTWLQGAEGPQDAFAEAVDMQMRGAGIIKTPAPAAYTHFHLQEIWTTIEEIPSPPLTVDEFTCGPGVYTNNQREWWKLQGVPLVRKICQYARIDAGGSNLTAKEACGKTLSQDECVHIVSTAQWATFRAAVNSGDVETAIASIDGQGITDMQIMRGSLMVANCVGVKIKENEREKKVVFSVLRSFEALVNRAHQGTIKSSFVTRAIVPLNFVEDVRNLVCGIDDVGTALRGGMAELLECKVSQLKEQPYAAVNLALRTVVQCWYTMMGSQIGDEAVRNITSPLTMWAIQDGTFAHWCEFISSGPFTTPCAMSLIEVIIVPRLVEWFDVYWSALRGATATGPTTTLGKFFEPREWMRTDFDYMEMRKCVRGLERGTPSDQPFQAKAASVEDLVAIEVAKRVKGNAKLCNFCVQNGDPPFRCKHEEKDCYKKNPSKKRGRPGQDDDGKPSKKQQRQEWMRAGKCLKCGSPEIYLQVR